jgi:hypothetical protein
VKGNGSFATDENPTAIISVGYDGILAYTDTKEQASYMINRTRGKPLLETQSFPNENIDQKFFTPFPIPLKSIRWWYPMGTL